MNRILLCLKPIKYPFRDLYSKLRACPLCQINSYMRVYPCRSIPPYALFNKCLISLSI